MTEEDGADNRALVYYEDKTLAFENDDEYGWIECPQHIHYISNYNEYVWVFFAGTGEYEKTTSLLQERALSFPIFKLSLLVFCTLHYQFLNYQLPKFEELT